MKLIISLSILLCLSCSSGYLEESKINDGNNVEIFSVKSVISNSHPNFGPGEARFQNKTKIYNINKTTELSYSVDKVSQKVNYEKADTTYLEYNALGSLTSYTSIDNYCFKFNYIYDSQNRIIKEISSNCDGKIGSEIIKTFTDSLIIEKSGESNQNKILYTLDASGNRIKRQDYNGGENVTTYWTKEFDINNNVVDFKFYIYDSLEFHQTYVYDTEGALVSSKVIKFPDNLTSVYDVNGDLMVSYSNARIQTFEYDETNNIITTNQIYDSIAPKNYNYHYDKYGNLLEINSITNNIKEIGSSYRYKYDKFGNVTERKSFWQGELRNITKCNHEYNK